MKIVSNDGHEFKTVDECLAHEAAVKATEKEKLERVKELETELEKIKKEISELFLQQDDITVKLYNLKYGIGSKHVSITSKPSVKPIDKNDDLCKLLSFLL